MVWVATHCMIEESHCISMNIVHILCTNLATEVKTTKEIVPSPRTSEQKSSALNRTSHVFKTQTLVSSTSPIKKQRIFAQYYLSHHPWVGKMENLGMDGVTAGDLQWQIQWNQSWIEAHPSLVQLTRYLKSLKTSTNRVKKILLFLRLFPHFQKPVNSLSKARTCS